MPQDPITVVDERPVRLDLASGQVPREGFTGVDLLADTPGVQFADLLRFPWPWASASVDEVVCSHFVEHIPMGYVDENNIVTAKPSTKNKEMFFAFFDELHRVLKPGGKAEIVVPYVQSRRAFQDPTHRRFLSEESFLYLDAQWRAMNRLDHYVVDCDFVMRPIVKIVDQLEGLRHVEVQAARAQNCWNVVHDIKVDLVKR